jgi:hypothetical protein
MLYFQSNPARIKGGTKMMLSAIVKGSQRSWQKLRDKKSERWYIPTYDMDSPIPIFRTGTVILVHPNSLLCQRNLGGHLSCEELY